jgi:gliding motility-associated-like protein
MKNNFFSNSIQQLVLVVAILIGNIAQAQWTQTSQANIYSPASGTLSALGDFGEGTDNNGVEYIAYTQFISGIPSTNDFIRIKKLNPTTKQWESFGPTYASTIPARHPRIAFDANNDLYIAFIEITNGSNNKVIIKKYNSSTQNWENAFGTSESPLIGVNNSQILSNQNNAMDFDFSGLTPLVAMHITDTPTPTVNIFTYNGSTWQSSLINSSNYNGTYFDLAKNGNKVYFFYPNSTGNIQGVFYENGAWNVLAGTATFGSNFIPRFVTKFHNSDIFIGIYSYSNNNKFAKLFKYSSNSYTDISSPNFSNVGNSLDAFHFDITPQGEVIVAYCNATTTPTFGYTALKYASNAWSTLACENFTFGRSTMIQNARSINIQALSNTEYLINTVSSSSANIGLSFVYNPPAAPTISSFSPGSGPIGSTVTITGTNFLCASAVSFNGTAATSFTVNSATSITATVPTGATTGAIAVTTAGGTATSSSNYNVAGEIIAEYQFNNSLAASIGGFGVASFGSTAATLNATTICTDAISSTANSLKIPNISSLNSAAFQVDLDFNVTSLPASTGTVFLLNTGQRAFSLSLNSSGSLSIYGKFSGSTATFSTQSTAGLITAGTNYKISVQVVANSIRVTLDNTLVLVHTLATGIDLSTKDFTLGDHLAAPTPLAMCIDNFRIINNPNQFAYAEQITFTPSVFSDFSTCVNATSNAQTFSVSGTNLFNDVVITSDLSSIIEMSLDGTSYASSLTLPMTAGTVNTTTVYIRFKGGSSAQSFTGTNARTLRISSGLSNTPIYRLSTSLSGTILALPTISGTNSITVGGTATLSATTTAAASSPWVSSNTAVATVNSSGVVTGIAGGTTTLTYTNSGGCQATYTVTVSPPPTITSFTPTSGAIGSTVTFTGTNFTGATAVSFNGTAATTFSATNATTLTATVPTGATTGTIAVTTPGGTATSATSFTVVPVPTITSFTPTTATTGATVTLTGTNFTGATAVSFNGTAATSFTVVSATSITVTVPSGASTGTITVTTAGGTATSASSLTLPIPPPTITSFSPTSGAAGSAVTITGTGFNATASNNVVRLNGMKCTVTNATATSLTVTVPSGTGYGKFFITNLGTNLNAYSNNKFSISSSYSNQTIDNTAFVKNDLSNAFASTSNSTQRTHLVGDFNDDSRMDIAFYTSSGALNVYRNNATSGSLTSSSFALSSSNLQLSGFYNSNGKMLSTDLNGDGKLDLALTNGGYNGGFANINSSSSGVLSFNAASDIRSSNGQYNVSSGFEPYDVNSDGKIDFVGFYSANWLYNSVNTTSGTTFSVATGNTSNSYAYSSTTSVLPLVTESFDVDGDGKQDLIFGTSSGLFVSRNTTTPFSNQLNFSYSNTTISSGLSTVNCINTADINTDGKLDVVITEGNMLRVYLNTSTSGTISFASPLLITMNSVRGLGFGDIDSDGKVDIVVSDNSGTYFIKNNTTQAATTPTFANKILVHAQASILDLNVIDFDRDGKLDIVGNNNNNFYLLRNQIGELPSITLSNNTLNTITNCKTPRVIADHSQLSTNITLTKDDIIIVENGNPKFIYFNAADGNYYGNWIYAANQQTAINTTSATSLNDFLSINPGAQVLAVNFPGSSFQVSSFNQALGQVQGTAYIPYYESFTVSGVNLSTNPLTITPPANFQVSTNQTTWIGSTTTPTAISLTPSTGTVATTTVYVRTTPSIAANSYSGNITMASTGATSGTKAVAATISAPTVISSQPTATVNVCQGASYTLGASGTGSGSLSYQWYSNTSNSNTGGTSLGSANFAQTGGLSIVTTTPGTYYYYLEVTGSCGKAVSNVATITISPTTVAGTSSAASNSVCSGTSASLSLTGHTGTIQWQSSPNNSTWTNISGASAASYTTAALTATTYYRAVVTSGVCAAANSNVTTISIVALATVPAITGNNALCVGSTATLSNTQSGGTWSSLTPAVATIDANGLVTALSGGTSVISYSVIDGNNCTASSNLTLTVANIPVAPTTLSATPTTVCAGSAVNLNATTAASGVNWYTDSISGAITGSSLSGSNFSVTAASNTPKYYAESYNTIISGTQTIGYTGAISTFTVPAGVTKMTIDTRGASGGNTGGRIGGKGARMVGEFTVTPGQVLKVLVGGTGSVGTYAAGGGGGTFVTDNSNNPLCIAGGGGGAQSSAGVDGNPGLTTTSGGGWNGGTNGNGGGQSYGSGGGGLLTNGTSSGYGGPGLSFLNGGTGGAGCASAGAGGFGGGSGGEWCYVGSAGAGGGYSGGGGNSGAGNGGGSFNNGTNQSNTQGFNTGNGSVVFSWNIGSCPSTARTPLPITVNESIAGTASAASTTICTGTAASLTLTGSTGTIQWQSSSNNSTWTNISGATAATYTTPTLTSTTYYRAVVTSGSCASVNSNVVTITITTNQPFANALALNGTGKIQFGNQTAAAVSTNFTIEAWVNVPSSAWSLQTVLSNSPTPSSLPGFKFAVNNWNSYDGKIVLEGSNSFLSSATAVTKDVWQHVAVVVNGTNVTFYINGNISGSYTGSFNATSAYPLTIGDFSGGSYPFNGTMDELRLWNVSKSQQDIQAAMYTPLAGNESGLAAYFNFNQGTPGGTNTGIANLLDNGPNAFTGSLSEITRTGTAENFVLNTNTMGITGSLACVGSTVQLNHPQSGGTWTSVTTSVATVSSTGLVTCLTAGSSVITYAYTYNGCQFTNTYTVTVNATPSTPTVANTTISYCQNGNATALSATAAASHSLRWYTVATGGTGSSTAITPVTSTAGTFTYYVSQANASGCEGPRVAITVTVSPVSVAGTASVNLASVCGGSTVDLSLTGNTGTVQWQSSLNNSTWTNISGATTATYTTSALSATTYFRAVVTSGGCTAANSNVLTVTVTTIAVPTTTTSITECQGNTATQLSATALSGHTLQWYTVSTGGTASTNAITPDLSNAAVTTYYVSQLNNTSNCESARVPIVVTVYALPAAPTTTTTINYCKGATPSALTATATSGLNLQWYTTAIGGTASNTAPTPTTSTVGTTTYYVSQKANAGSYSLATGNNGTLSSMVQNLGQTFQVANNIVLNTINFDIIFFYSPAPITLKIYNGFGGALIATANSVFNPGYYHNYNVQYSFSGQNLQLNAGQTYYMELTSSQNMFVWLNSNVLASGVTYSNGVAQAGNDFGFTLAGTLNVNPCESPRTAITVNVNDLPTITGVQNMTVGGSTLQLTGSGTPNANSPWTSSSTSTATISATGEVTAVAGGSTIITYTNADGCSISQSITVVDCSQPLGNVLHFDGVNDYITTASNIPALNITADLTLETWIKFDQVHSDFVRLIGKGDANNRTYGLWLQTDGKLLFQINGTPTGLNFTSTTSLQPGIWYHIAAIRNGNTAKIFINGVEDATATTNVSPQTNTFPLIVGHGTIHNYLKGSLEDVRVWNIARTVSQIQQGMYNSIDGNETGLVAYYDFNQGIASGNNTTITTANDKSLNTLNATLTNFGKTGGTSNFIGNTIVNFAVSGASIVCANSTSQFTHPRSGGTWSISNGASASINSSGLLTTLANENVTVSYTYTINGCSVTDSKSVSINTPAAPVVTTPVNLCQGVTATALTATASSGLNLLWYTAATGGTASNTAPIPTTTTIGATTYYVSQKATSGAFVIDNPSVYSYANYVSNIGQSFNVSSNVIVNSITLKEAFFDYSNANTVLKIYNGYGGALLATANSPYVNAYSGWNTGILFSFTNQNIILTSGQTYYFEIVSSSTMYPKYSNAYANGTGYINGGVISQDFAFKLDASINSNPCESPRTAIVVNVNAIPTITGAQNMTVGGATLQLTGSGTPNANSPWTSSNTAVATISATGEVTAVAGGSTTITYTNSDGCSITAAINVIDCSQPFGNALSFGVGTMVSNADFVEVNSRIFPTQTVADFTIETWIKPSASDIVSGTPGGSWFGFLGSQNSQRNPSMWITNSGALHASWWDNGYGGTPVSASTPSSLIADKWTHVALVKDGTTMRIYANGIQVNSAACSPTITVPNNNYWFGKVDNQFNGSLDEVRFWSTARTQAQIAASMYTELVGNEAGLLANFDFNQGIANGNNTAITTVINKANSALNGTLTNFTKTGTSSNFVANSITSYPITGAAIVCANSTAQYTHPVSGGTWTISNGANATISNSGLLTTAANENVTVSYTYTLNGCSKTETKTVTIESPLISGLTSVGAGNTITLTASTTPASSNAWVSSNPAKATVSASGVVSGLATGTTIITFTNNNACTDTALITIVTGTTLAPTLTSPATNTTGATTLNIVYSLPEAPLAGSVTLTFTPVGGGTPIVWTMNNATPANFNYVVGTNPVSSNVTAGTALGFTTYDITLSYQDAFSNPAASVTNTNIQTLAPPVISFVSSSYATVVNSTLTINTINTGGSMVTYSISPALPTGFTFNTTTGVITGSSSVALSATTYTVTATNAAGTSTATVSIAITADTDGDGIPDIADADVNGDGVIDNGPDTDGDGIIDLYDNDIDGDGIPNNLDNDADGDGVPNSQDVCAFIPNTAITVQPSTTNQVICPSATISPLTVTATGPGLSYQWYRNTTATTTGGTLLTGATSASYSPLNTVVGTAYYYVVVSGTCGTATSNVSGSILVTDITLPTVVTQNRTIYLNATGQATITAAQIDNGSTDNCAIATRTLSQTTFNCNNVGANNVTLTVTDASGNIRTGNATVTVVDSIKPTVVTQNITVNLNASGQATITAAQINNGSSDNCGIASVTVNQTAFTCANTGANTVTLTVTDVNGNVKTKTATVTVVDNILPTVVTQNVIRYLNASGQVIVTANDINNGSTDNCGIGTLALSQTAFTCAHVGVNTVTLTVTDTKGNTATGQATVTIIDNTPPTAIAQNINAYLNAGGAVTVTPNQVGGNSTDNCSIATMTLNNTTFNCSNLGANPVILTVVDPFNNVSTANAVITVVDSIKPLLTIPADITVNTNSGCGAFGFPIGTASATDNCSVISAITNNAPTFYPVGITNIVYSVTDGSGNTKTKIQKVTVIDNVIPIITAPASITTTLTAGCTKTGLNLGTPVTSDNCTIASVTNNAPTAFPVGTTTVTWTVTDASGNTATATQTVTVTDAINPTITAPANLTINANASCVAFGVNLGTPVRADNCTVASVTNNAPAVFPLGITTVTWIVTDGSGNTASANQQVNVIDNSAPTLVAPAALTVNANSGCTATGVNLGTAVKFDNCSIVSTTNNAPTAFPLGTTTVTWTVTDGSGNSTTATQLVTVIDNVNPTITAPAAVTATTNNGCTRTGLNLGTPVTADNCSVASVTNNAPIAFPIGTTIVTWTVTDGSGKTATATQTVTINDIIFPTITAPAAITANTTTGCIAANIALGTPVTADNCSVATITNNAPAVFPLGTTTVTWTVKDGSGNTTTATQTVTIVDIIYPTIVAPAAITVNTTTGCTAIGSSLGTPVTADNCSVATVTNNAPTSFPIGTTTVTWTVTDGSGNSTTATQLVTVIDNVNPTITAPSAVSANTTNGCTASGINLGTPVTADNCTVASVTNNAPSVFPIGSTTVTWTVTDGSGNSATATQVVTVSDVTNPTITAPVAITVTTNSGCEASGIALGLPITADNCTVASVTNNAPATFPIGTTTVTWTVTDAAGNTSTATQTVTVIDNINPSIIAPSAVTFYVSSGCSVNGIVIGTPVTADNCTVASVTNNAPATFPIGSTTVTWTVTDGAGNSAVATQVIQVIDTIAPTALINDVTVALDLTGTATVTSSMIDAGSFDNCGLESIVLSQSLFGCNDLGTNVVQVTITDSYGNSAIAYVKVTITPSGIDVDMDGIDDACDEFVNTQIVQVPSGFSPNGDNINDTFIIPALDQFTKVQLQVYNKYGHEVYVSSLYKNDWNGTSSFNGLELPDDTYFYILNTDGELRQGFVYINRIK